VSGGHHRLDGRRAEGVDQPQAVGQPRVVAELDAQDLGVDGRRLHSARGDQADGPLVKAGLEDRAEEAGAGAHADQAVEGDGVAGVGGWLVVGPGAAAQLPQAGDRAVVADDHI
jgi:hypothetical protein